MAEPAAGRVICRAPIVRRPVAAPRLPGTFTLPDESRFFSLPEGVDRSALTDAQKALANTNTLLVLFKQYVQELGPALKKLKTSSGPVTVERDPTDVLHAYKTRFDTKSKHWLRAQIASAQTTANVWPLFKDKHSQRTLVAEFFAEHNLNIQNPRLEREFTRDLGSKRSTLKGYLLNELLRCVYLFQYIQHAVETGRVGPDGHFVDPPSMIPLDVDRSAEDQEAFHVAIENHLKYLVTPLLTGGRFHFDDGALDAFISDAIKVGEVHMQRELVKEVAAEDDDEDSSVQRRLAEHPWPTWFQQTWLDSFLASPRPHENKVDKRPNTDPYMVSNQQEEDVISYLH